MTETRWQHLMNADIPILLPEEMALGWHWCGSWDGMLVGPGMDEMACCECDGVPEGLKEAAQKKLDAEWMVIFGEDPFL